MLPPELLDKPQWLVSGEDKAPRSPKLNGRHVDVRDKNFFVTYPEATAFALQHGMDIGFALTPEDPFVVVDLDAPANEDQRNRHQLIYESFQSYAELSRSGKGVHIWCQGSLPSGARRDSVEVYPHSRYMICTGRTIKPLPVSNCQELLDKLYQEIGHNFDAVPLIEEEALLSDRDVVEMGMRAVNSEKFDQLCRGEWQGEYPSQSEADFALMNMLCYYSRSNIQVKRLFRLSALGRRDKAQREKYLDGMIAKIRAEEPPPVEFKITPPAPASAHSRANGTDRQATQVPYDVESFVPDTAPLIEAAIRGTWAEEVTYGKEPDVLPTGPILVDMSIRKPLAEVPAPKRNNLESLRTVGHLTYPPGLIGEIARYIVESSTRPVPEVGVTAALGLCAGILGRQFNISGTGLNQYLILLAKTGIGKEGGASGIERLLKAARPSAPIVDSFLGPGTFASGQAIIRSLDENPCFVSILGEFGLTLQDLSDANANSLSRVMRRVLLDLYTKSGKSSVLYSSAYSDKEKNTKTLFAPAMTLLGESTPDAFYAGLSPQHIADGLIPRFLIVEYDGDRPPKNKHAFAPPSDELVNKLIDIADVALRMRANNTWEDVEIDEAASKLLDAFDKACDAHIREGGNEGMRQLWNRAHLKALRVSGLLAAADRVHAPVVSIEEAQWAIDIVRRDTEAMAARFERGDVGEDDNKQLADVRRILKDYTTYTSKEVEAYGVSTAMHAARVVPYVYFRRRCGNLSAFRNDRKGATSALKETLADLVRQGALVLLPARQSLEQFNFRGELYHVLTP